MNTYYTLNLTQVQRDTLLHLATIGAADQQNKWDYEPSHLIRKAYEDALDTLKNAPQHPNIEDVYLHDAQHGGFTAGEKVLLECQIVATSDHVSTLSVHHLAAVKGEEIMVANKLIHHMEA